MVCTIHCTITVSYKIYIFTKSSYFTAFCLLFEPIVLHQETGVLGIEKISCKKLPAPATVTVLSNKSSSKVDDEVIFKNESQNEKMKLKNRA